MARSSTSKRKKRKPVPTRLCVTCQHRKPREEFRGPGGGLFPSCPQCRAQKAYERERKIALRLRREHEKRERELERAKERRRRAKPEKAPQRPRKAPAKKAGKGASKPGKLAQRPWSELGKAQQRELRSWRARKGWRTRTDRESSALAERLSGEHGRRERDRARRELKREGTGDLARWLRKTKKLSPREVRQMFAFWMYAP